MSLDLVDFIYRKLYLDQDERDLQPSNFDECGMRKTWHTHVIIIKKDVGLVAIDHIYWWECLDRLVMVGELLVTRPSLEIRTSMYQVKASSQQRWAWHQDLMAPVLWSFTHSYSKLDHDPCDLDTFRILGAASIAPIQFACICDRDTDICMTNTSS